MLAIMCVIQHNRLLPLNLQLLLQCGEGELLSERCHRIAFFADLLTLLIHHIDIAQCLL